MSLPEPPDTAQIARIAAAEGLLAVYLFGSQATGAAGQNSDVDLALLFRADDQRWRDVATYMTLVDAFGSCLPGYPLDLILLPKAPLELQRAVLDGRVVFCADDDLRTDWEDRVLRDYLDFAAELRLYEAEVAEAIREGKGQGYRSLVLSQLDDMRRSVLRLEKLAQLSRDEFLQDPDHYAIAEHYLRRALEAALDASRHIIAKEGWGRPSEYRDVLDILGTRGILPAEFARRIRPPNSQHGRIS